MSRAIESISAQGYTAGACKANLYMEKTVEKGLKRYSLLLATHYYSLEKSHGRTERGDMPHVNEM